ncbi:MAG: UPF0280 family protein [Dehalococcoidia bacterium]|nr:MAG: UPF0280 family protein [Dehalococcoidia bacterium]
MYQPKTYRLWIQGQDLISFHIIVKESDLYIRASSDLSTRARKSVLKHRRILEEYITKHPSFATSLTPILVKKGAPPIISKMSTAAAKANVGPMAAVAGTIAYFVGQDLAYFSPELIIENGGDIYLKSLTNRTVAIFAGNSLLSGKIGLEIKAVDTPIAICTSSGTVGHSLSLGKADAVVTVSKDAALADAAATAIANRIFKPDDIQPGIEFAKGIAKLMGVVIIKNDQIGIWGELKVSRTRT